MTAACNVRKADYFPSNTAGVSRVRYSIFAQNVNNNTLSDIDPMDTPRNFDIAGGEQRCRASLVLIIVVQLTLQVCIFFNPGSPAAAQSDDDVWHSSTKETDSSKLEQLEARLRKEPENYDLLLTAAYLHLRLGWLYSDRDAQRKHYEELLNYSLRAQRLRPDEYQARLLHLVARAKSAGYLSMGEQVRAARDLKKDLDAIISWKGTDADTLYILSWLNFKVGRVTPLEKMLASLLFGGLPDSLTVENGIRLMEKALQLRPDYAVYYYDLGLYQERIDQLDEAFRYFEKALNVQAKSPEEFVYQQRARDKIKELQAMRKERG